MVQGQLDDSVNESWNISLMWGKKWGALMSRAKDTISTLRIVISILEELYY